MSRTGKPVATDEVVLDQVFTIPNLISFARMLLIPVFAWVFLLGDYDLLAMLLLVVIGSTDWIDGYVARRIGQVSKLGKLLDPVADRMAIVVVLLALVFRGVVPGLLAAVLLLRDLLVTIAFPILEARGFDRIPVNWTGKWATALIFAGMAMAAASVLDTPVRTAAEVSSLTLLAAGAVAYWVAGGFYVREVRKQMRVRATG